MIVSIAEVSDFAQAAGSAGTDQGGKVKDLHTALMNLVVNHDNATDQDVLNSLLGISQQSAAIEKELGPQGNPGLLNQLRTIRFKSSRTASHIYRSLNGDGRDKVKPTVKQILAFTPSLSEAGKPEHFKDDDELRRFAFPPGSLHHGRALGLEKQRTGFTEAAFGQKKAALVQQRNVARQQGRSVTEKEAGKIVTAMPVLPAVASSKAISATQKAAAQKAAKRAVDGYLGYFGQTAPEVQFYLNQKEGEFRSASVPNQIEILDKVASVSESTNSGIAPTVAIAQAESAGSTMDEGIPEYVWWGLGGATALGILILFLTRD